MKVDEIIKEEKEKGEEEINKGYGLIQEKKDLVDEVEEEGIILIGKQEKEIREMGMKDEEKEMMEKEGVKVVKGYKGENKDGEFIKREEERIKYKVIIKERDGGGGKGMRRVDRDEDFDEEMESERREEEEQLGDGEVMVEKYMEKKRNIEVKVFGDNKGNEVNMLERD